MATENQIIKQLREHLKEAERIITKAKIQNGKILAELMSKQDEASKNQDLIFALLLTLGPKINMRIDHFRAICSNAAFRGTIDLQETGSNAYVASLEFSQKGDFTDIEPQTTEED